MRDDAAEGDLRLEVARANRNIVLVATLRWWGAMWLVILLAIFMLIKVSGFGGVPSPLPQEEWVVLYVISVLSIAVPLSAWPRGRLSGVLFVVGGALLLWALTWPFWVF